MNLTIKTLLVLLIFISSSSFVKGANIYELYPREQGNWYQKIFGNDSRNILSNAKDNLEIKTDIFYREDPVFYDFDKEESRSKMAKSAITKYLSRLTTDKLKSRYLKRLRRRNIELYHYSENSAGGNQEVSQEENSLIDTKIFSKLRLSSKFSWNKIKFKLYNEYFDFKAYIGDEIITESSFFYHIETTDTKTRISFFPIESKFTSQLEQPLTDKIRTLITYNRLIDQNISQNAQIEFIFTMSL